jgi:hypothetical protein
MVRLWNYRELRGDFRLTLVAVRRAVEVPRAFRMGFLAIVFLAALRELAGFGFVPSFLVLQPPTSSCVASAFLLRQLRPQRDRQSRYQRPGPPLQSPPRRQPLRRPVCSQPCLCLYQRHSRLYPCHPCLPPHVDANDARSCKPSCQQEVFVMHSRSATEPLLSV